MKPALRAWVIAAVLVIAWAALGPLYAGDGPLDNLLAKIGAIAACAVPLTFIVVYTAIGIAGAAKWWRWDIGTCLVLFMAGVIAQNLPLAWAFIFHHGMLNTPVDVWTYLGGLLGGSILIGWCTRIWLRIHLRSRKERDNGT
jgi:hypothetical protein